MSSRVVPGQSRSRVVPGQSLIKRVAVKQEEDAEENRKRRRISNHEEESQEAGSNIAAPPIVACAVVRLQVKSLLDPKLAETTIDALLGLRLDEEENFGARDDFKSTDICTNLVAAMEQNANNNSAIFQKSVAILSSPLRSRMIIS
jgi:rRNA maturation endonuclease Nob1